MSFKREGDDFGWLNRNRKRRIDELLSADIPEEEALLMKNGRFCCIVCYNRPIFDTVNMLAIHRAGKNHAIAIEKVNQEKLDLELLKLKREQQTYLSTGNVTTNQDQSNNSGSLKLVAATPYDPRVKRKKHRHDRKQVLDLSENKDLSDNSDTLTSNLNVSPQLTGVNLMPYKTKPCAQKIGPTKPNTIGPHYSASARSKSGCMQEKGPNTISEYVKFNESENRTVTLNPYGQNHSGPSNSCQFNPRTGSMKSTSPAIQPQVRTKPAVSSSTEKSRGKSSKQKTQLTESTPQDEEKLKSAEKYLQARGAGWKKDLSGNWVREEGVEFDSDDEPPDLP